MRTMNPSLVYDGSKDCRSLQDAVAKLEELDAFVLHDSAHIHAAEFSRPDGERTNIVVVEAMSEKPERFVRLYTGDHFSSKTLDGVPVRRPTTDLSGAEINRVGTVTLRDGTHLGLVNLRPGLPLMYDFGLLEDAITQHALTRLGKHKCYPEPCPELLPGVRFLDYGEVSKMRAPRQLKRLANEIGQCFRNVPYPTIVEALRQSGIKFH